MNKTNNGFTKNLSGQAQTTLESFVHLKPNCYKKQKKKNSENGAL